MKTVSINCPPVLGSLLVTLTKLGLAALLAAGLTACISTSNSTVDGFGTPDVTECTILDGVQDGAEYAPRTATTFGTDGRTHPDVFFMGWSTLDNRSDLRFPTKGYDGSGFEDKLFVIREDAQGGEATVWQLLPKLTETCEDEEKIRIHSFDVAPDGRSLYLSMRRDDHARLAIYEFDINAYTFSKITNDDSADFINPTYIGDDENTGNPMLMVAKTVTTDEFPNLYTLPSGKSLKDEYDRDRTTLIHTLDTVTKAVKLIGLNNSHQFEPVLQTRPNGQRVAIFTQWEHQQTTNRFALWKMQIDGSDSFTIYGGEARTDQSTNGNADLSQPRVINSGPYKDYILMTQGRGNFAVDGSILMTKRAHLDLRSDPVFLETLDSSGSEELHISRNPEHYNAESFVYAYRADKEKSYSIALKDFSAALSPSATAGPSKTLFSADNLHLVHPRSYYPPTRAVTAPGDGSIGESRISFTNSALNGNSGFLVSRINQSDNGVQHQLDGIDPAELKMRFFVPSHHVSVSTAVGSRGQSSPELSVPASDFIDIESDGSFAAVLKPGMYVWKMYKRKYYRDGYVYIPVRAERQEVNFVPNRVNACNQCHQERNQANIDLYENLPATIARQKMQSSDLSSVYSNVNYDIDAASPDFHAEIMPLFTTPAANGKSCADCHNSYDKLNLANTTGISSQSPTWTNMVLGAHKLDGADPEVVVPYVSTSINPLGFANLDQYAPFMWSLMLGDDLADQGVSGERVISTATDFGAKYDARVVSAITNINDQYDHTQHWTRDQLQTFINYTTTQTMVGLSNKINFSSNSIATNTAAAQKAFQAMIGSQGGKGASTKCFDCHNDFNDDGIADSAYGLPLEKRFNSSSGLRKTYTRLIMQPHISAKGQAVWSKYRGQSDLETAFANTMNSARERIDFSDLDNSELLVYARGRKLVDGSDPTNRPAVDNVSNHPALLTTDADYIALANWVKGVSVTNDAPVINTGILPANIVVKEYADPAYLVDPTITCDTVANPKCDDLVISWSDPESDLAQMMLSSSSSGSAHNFSNDSMVAMEYGDRDGNNGMTSARVQTYAILGDRGEQKLEFKLTDGQASTTGEVSVTVESDYDVPMPQNVLPAFEAFYVNARTGELHKLTSDANNDPIDTVVGVIQGVSGGVPVLTSVYRRADKGWLYFIAQGEQRIYVVDETNANVLHTIKINKNETYVKGDTGKQTQYLVWWRPAETIDGVDYPGMLQGILEVKLSEGNNGDWYVSLGDGEPPAAPNTEVEVTPTFLTKLANGENTIGAYVWRRATFTVQLVQNGTDNLNALNLVTGRDKNLANYNFAEKLSSDEPYSGTAFTAHNYMNVRAVIVAADGRFYGINQDLNADPELFQFDPVNKIQQKIDNIPSWLLNLMTDTGTYTAPFVYIP